MLGRFLFITVIFFQFIFIIIILLIIIIIINTSSIRQNVAAESATLQNRNCDPIFFTPKYLRFSVNFFNLFCAQLHTMPCLVIEIFLQQKKEYELF